MTLSYFQSNIKILEQRNPILARFLCSLSLSDEYICEPSKKGDMTLSVRSGDRSIRLHSAYDPAREANQQIANTEISPTADLVCFGFGLGYHVEKLCELKSKREFIMVVEADVNVVRTAFEYRDLSRMLSDPRVVFSVGESPQNLFNFLKQYGLSILANGLCFFEHPASFQLWPGHYNPAKEAVSEIFKWAKVNYNTQSSKAEIFAGNIMKNLPEFIASPGIRELFEAFKGAPAFIAAAGPSLDKNVDYLRMVGDRGLIVAVDSAVKTLCDKGVRPDIVVSIDFGENNLRHLEGFDSTGMTLIYDPEVHPRIPANFKGNKFVINLKSKSLCEWLQTVIGDKGTLEKGLSVAHTAFSLCLYFGCAPIVFLGQDLAYPRGEWHTKGSAMFQKADEQDDIKKRLCRVHGYFGGEVMSETSLTVFLRHFESMLSNLDVPVFDATEGGALIKGMRNISLRDAIARYCVDDVDKGLLTKDYPVSKRDAASFYRAGEAILRKLEFCNQGAYKAYNAIEHMLAELQKPNPDPSGFGECYRNIAMLIQKIGADEEVLAIMKDTATNALLVRAKREAEDIKLSADMDLQVLRRLFKKEHMFFESVVKSSDFLAQKFCDVLNRVRPELAK